MQCVPLDVRLHRFNKPVLSYHINQLLAPGQSSKPLLCLLQIWVFDGQNRILDKIVGRRKKRRSFEYEVGVGRCGEVWTTQARRGHRIEVKGSAFARACATTCSPALLAAAADSQNHSAFSFEPHRLLGWA